jgi:four helix bundle protein
MELMKYEKRSILKEKSFTFAICMVKLSRTLCEQKREFVMSKQILRSGTSIGALIREAQNAESKADFIHKLGIAQKECDETIYWLELLWQTDFIGETEFNKLNSDATELLRMIRSSILTSKQNSKR